MKTVTVYGASDDLIEVDGDIREEFYANGDDGADYLAFSNGLVLQVIYGDEGVWRINTVEPGYGEIVTRVPAPIGDDNNYSDRVTVKADFRWIMHGKGIVT